MIKIPGDNNKYSQPNNSDLFGKLWYTRNINLDEEGYIKLSPRAVSIASEKTDSDFGLPVAYGRSGNAGGTLLFRVVTTDEGYSVTISDSDLTITQDSGSPAILGTDTHGRWFHNLWVVAGDSDFYTRSSDGSTYTDKGNLTSGKAHPVEVFRNKDRICFGDGNTVKMYSESGGTFTADTTLTIPSDHEVVKISYNNYKMGVLGNLSDDTAGQNQEAYFFTWDGTSTEANSGIGIGSDKGIDVRAYKGSWVVLSRTGQLLFYTGGGWQVLASLPFYFKQADWGDSSTNRDAFGDIMEVDGDVIYININGNLEPHTDRYETYMPNNPGGVWCYDPSVGLYHRYSPSISPVNLVTVSSANVNTTTNIFTANSGTVPSTGSPIKYLNKGNQIGGLSSPTVYYCIKESSSTFKLATSKENAEAGIAVDITSTGDTSNYFLALELYDYGQTQLNDTGAIGMSGGQNNIIKHVLIGAEMLDFESTSDYEHLCILSSGFENRGCFVTPKIPASQIEDVVEKIVTSYRPFNTGDELILKYKNKEILGLPVSTPQATGSTRNQCTWTNGRSFYTTANLSIAESAIDDEIDLECEIIAGAGSGAMAQIESISSSGGTYVVTLSEDIPGAASGRYCDMIIDNWTVLKTKADSSSITSDDTVNYIEFPVALSSNWGKIKGELRGVGTTIEMVKVINSGHKPN
jgi:hypothetical protein